MPEAARLALYVRLSADGDPHLSYGLTRKGGNLGEYIGELYKGY